MSLNDVCEISALLNDEGHYEEEQRQKLLDRQRALKAVQDRMDQEVARDQQLSAAFEDLLIKVADEKNVLKGKNLLMSTLKDDCEQQQQGVSSEQEEDEKQNRKRACLQEVLLEDLESAEAQMDWLDSWWRQYLELSAAGFAERVAQIQADVELYKNEIGEIESNAAQVLLLSKDVQEQIEATSAEKINQEGRLLEQHQQQRALELAISGETQRLEEQLDLSQRHARDSATEDVLASNAQKRVQLQEQRQREALAEEKLTKANADVQAALSEKPSIEAENDALKLLVAEESVPVTRLQQELEASKQLADKLGVDAQRVSRDVLSSQRHQDALTDSLLAFDESSSTICATVDKIQESTNELQAEIGELRDQLCSPPKRNLPPELAGALSYAQKRASELVSIKAAQEEASRQTDEATQSIHSLVEDITSTERQISKEASATAQQQSLLRTLSSEDAMRDAFASESGLGICDALFVPLDEEWQTVDAEVQDRAQSLEAQMQALLQTQAEAASVHAELQEVLAAHQAQVERLEQERVSMQFEVQTKKALAEHRRDNIQKHKQRKAALVAKVEGADADFQLNWEFLDEELSGLEKALEAECAGLYDLHPSPGPGVVGSKGSTTKDVSNAKAGSRTSSYKSSLARTSSARAPAARTEPMSTLKAKAKARTTSNTRKKNRRQARTSARTPTSAAASSSPGQGAAPVSKVSAVHSVFDFDQIDEALAEKAQQQPGKKAKAKGGSAKRACTEAYSIPAQQRKAVSSSSNQSHKRKPGNENVLNS